MDVTREHGEDGHLAVDQPRPRQHPDQGRHEGRAVALPATPAADDPALVGAAAREGSSVPRQRRTLGVEAMPLAGDDGEGSPPKPRLAANAGNRLVSMGLGQNRFERCGPLMEGLTRRGGGAGLLLAACGPFEGGADLEETRGLGRRQRRRTGPACTPGPQWSTGGQRESRESAGLADVSACALGAWIHASWGRACAIGVLSLAGEDGGDLNGYVSEAMERRRWPN